MLDFSLHRLLEEVVNSSTKLAIVLLYTERAGLSATAESIAQRLTRDIGSVETALRELVEDGILEFCHGQYCYRPAPEWREGLGQLMTAYDEPLYRLEIMRIVNDLDLYAPYRRALRSRSVQVFSS